MSYRLEHCEESGWSLKGVSEEGHSCDHQLESRKYTKMFRLRRASKGDVVNLEKHESLSRRITIRCQSNRLGATRDDSKVILQNLTGVREIHSDNTLFELSFFVREFYALRELINMLHT